MQTQVAYTQPVGPVSRFFSVAHAWIRKPTQVASVCPSSQILTRAIANRPCVRNASTIVDLGPGTGGTTQSLLRYARPTARVLAVELTKEFIPVLNANGDPRLTVQQGDAAQLDEYLSEHGLGSPDVIVSGIPFSSLSKERAEALIEKIHNVLLTGGVFIAYQFRDHVVKYAEPYFGDPATQRVWFNLPPLDIHTWVKPIHRVRPPKKNP